MGRKNQTNKRYRQEGYLAKLDYENYFFSYEEDKNDVCDYFDLNPRNLKSKAPMWTRERSGGSGISREEFQRRVRVYNSYGEVQSEINSLFAQIDYRHLRFSKIESVYAQFHFLFHRIRKVSTTWGAVSRFNSMLAGFRKRFDQNFGAFLEELKACRFRNPSKFDAKFDTERITELRARIVKKSFSSLVKGSTFNSLVIGRDMANKASTVQSSTETSFQSKDKIAKESVDSKNTDGHQFVKDVVADVKNVAGAITPLMGMGSLIGLFDRPSEQEDPGLNMSVSDVKLPVQSMGFRYADYRPDASGITQSETWDGNLSKLLQVPNRIAVGSWTTTIGAGEQLFSIPVSPVFCDEEVNGTEVIRNNTVLSYYSDMYNLWRGSLVYEVEVIASAFHQGQLFLCYTPGTTEYKDLPTVTNMQSVTMDIGRERSVKFTVPWLTCTDYKCCIDTAKFDFLDADKPYVNGVFNVFVQNPLSIQSETIVNNVEVNIYITAGPDFELKDPRVPTCDSVFIDTREVLNEDLAYHAKTTFQSDDGAHFQKTEVQQSENFSDVSVNTASLGKKNIGGKQMVTNEFAGRTFRLGTGEISINDARLASLQNFDIPNSLLTDRNLSISRVADVAYLANFDVKITLKIQPTQFHQGSLIVWFQPYGYGSLFDNSISPASYQSFKHARLNLGGDTECSFVIPFASTCHAFEKNFGSADQGGSLYVDVWNQMKAASTSSSTLTFTIWFELVDPEFKVATVPTEWQSFEEEAEVTHVIDSDSTKGFLQEDHMNLYRYLDRPSRVKGFLINSTEDYLIGTDFDGFSHLYATAAFGYHSGSHRITLIGNASSFERWNFFCHYLTQGSNGYLDVSNIGDWDFVPSAIFKKLRSGKMCIWRPQEKNSLCMDLYQYSAFPTLNTKFISGPLKYASRSGYVVVQPRNVPTDQELQVDVYHTRGDDFRVYYPCGVRKTKVTRPVTTPDSSDPQDFHKEAGTEFQDSKYPRRKKRSCKLVTCDHEGLPIGGRRQHAHLCDQCGDLIIHTHRIVNSPSFNLCEHCKTSFQDGAPGFVEVVWSFLKTALEHCKEGMDYMIKIVKDGIHSLKSFLIDVLARFVWDCVKDKVKSTLAEMATSIKNGFQFVLESLLEFVKNFFSWILNKITGTIFQDKSSLFSTIMSFVPKSFKTLFEGFIRTIGAKFASAIDIQGWVDYAWEWFFPSERLQTFNGIIEKMQLKDYITEYYFRYGANALGSPARYTNCDSEDFVFSDVKFSKMTGEQFLAKGKLLVSIIMEYQDVIKNGSGSKRYLEFKTHFERNFSSHVKNQTESARAEPVGIIFSSDECGIGKTTLLTEVLPHLFLAHKYTREQVDSEIYSAPMNKDQKYFDGYKGQEWFYQDDMGSLRDGSDLLFMLQLISTSQTPVPMADIDEKGTLFTSKVVCGSTNYRQLNANDLKGSKPFLRRFPFTFTIGLKKDRFDKVKFFEELNSHESLSQKLSVLDSWYTLRKFNMETGRIEDESDFFTFYRQFRTLYDRNSQVQKLGSVQVDFQSGEKARGDWKGFVPYDSPKLASYYLYYTNKAVVWGRSWLNKNQLCEEDKKKLVEAAQWFGYDIKELDANQIRADFRKWSRRAHPDKGGDPTEYKKVSAYVEIIEKYLNLDTLDKPEWDFIDVPWDYVFEIDPETKRFTEDARAAYHVLIACKKENRKFYEHFVSTHPFISMYADILDGEEGSMAFRNILNFAMGVILWLLIRFLVKKVTSMGMAWLTGTTDEKKEEQESSFQNQYDGSKKKAKPVPKNLETIFQDYKDDGMYKFIENNNLYTIFSYSDGTQAFGYVLAIDQTHILMMRHYDRHVHKRLVSMRVQCCGVSRQVKFENLTYIKEQDYIIVETTTILQGVRDIRKRMLTKEQTGNLKIGTALGFYHDEEVHTGMILERNVVAEYIFARVKLDFTTEAGMCGRPYLWKNPTDGRVYLAGLHSGVNKMNPVFCVLSAEDLDFPRQAQLPEIETGTIFMNGNQVQAMTATKTSIVKSAIHDKEIFCEDFAPADLKPDILLKRMAVYEREPDHILPQRHFDYALGVMQAQLKKCEFDGKESELLDEDQILNHYDSLRPFDKASSAGWWNKVSKKKHGIIEYVEEENLNVLKETPKHPWTGTTFREHIEEQEQNLKDGEPMLTFWTATLKDELRSEAKRKLGKTRIFQAGGFDHSYLMKKYFGNFRRFYLRNRKLLYHAIGIDKPTHWAELKSYLTSKSGGKNCFDADGKDFGARITPQAFTFFMKFVDLICGSEHKIERQGLMNAVLSSRHIVLNQVREVFGGNKDGFYLTDVFNSVCNCMYAISSYSISFESKFGFMPEISSFDDDVALLTYGDDIVSEVAENCDYFNRNSLCEIYTALGMLMQPGDKRIGAADNYDPIENITFLKSHFVQEDDVVLAPMPDSVIYKQLNWHKKTVLDEPRIFVDIIQGVLKDSSHKGELFYNNIVSALRSKLADTIFSDQVTFPSYVAQINDIRLLQDSVKEEATTFQDGKLGYHNGAIAPLFGVL
ncbi:hypothetical protein [Beihai picorna-like virus 122]|uniref:hypothetical protein n=1 Tax=Beihai picorna-like virus 122 TaxID=1922551 RepID=UPI00090CD108|nr:hypothetical protein [Beihai picorna-like virus 122]APG78957.1 hypothetical protein [Beihai picorna-like virus 122]